MEKKLKMSQPITVVLVWSEDDGSYWQRESDYRAPIHGPFQSFDSAKENASTIMGKVQFKMLATQPHPITGLPIVCGRGQQLGGGANDPALFSQLSTADEERDDDERTNQLGGRCPLTQTGG